MYVLKMLKSRLLALNFDITCRGCLKEVQNRNLLTDIFGKNVDISAGYSTPPIFIKLMACAAIQVSNNDGFPRSICESCLKCLNEMCAFKELIEYSDAKLRKLKKFEKTCRYQQELEIQDLPEEVNRQPEPVVEVEPVREDIAFREDEKLGDVTPEEDISRDTSSHCPRGRSNPQHAPDFFTCSVCSKACRTATGLKAHKRTHDGKSLTCGDCGKSFGYKRLLNQHVLIHLSERSFLCSECGKAFKTKAHMKVHARRHFNNRPFDCRFCDKRFYQACHRNQHMNVHTGDRPFSCHRCDKRFRTQTGLKGHLRRHDGILPYKCDQCNKQFALKSSVKNHTRLHFGEKPYHCDICLKSFALSSSLRVHMKIHSAETASVCDTCGRKFSSIRHLTEHLRTHSDQRPFVCVTCGKGFKQKVGLTLHMKTHSQERPYQCDLCPKAFVTRKTYRRHSGLRPYTCKICGATFRQNITLKEHITVHMRVNSFNCPHCQNEFFEEERLNEHVVSCLNARNETAVIMASLADNFFG